MIKIEQRVKVEYHNNRERCREGRKLFSYVYDYVID